MEQGSLLQSFLDAGFCIYSNCIRRKEMPLYKYTFSLNPEVLLPEHHITINVLDVEIDLKLQFTPTQGPTIFDAKVFLKQQAEYREIINVGSNLITSLPPAKSLVEALSRQKPPYYQVTQTSVYKLQNDDKVFVLELLLKEKILELTIQPFTEYKIPEYKFNPQNIAHGNVFSGEASFTQKLPVSKSVKLWKLKIPIGLKSYELSELALEGFLWYKDDTGKPRLGGRFRKEQPRYCTFYKISSGTHSDYFLTTFDKYTVVE